MILIKQALWPTGDFVPFAAPPSTQAATTTTCTTTGPPTPQFSYHDINVYALAGLAPHININANVSIRRPLKLLAPSLFSPLDSNVPTRSFLVDLAAPGPPAAEAVRAAVGGASCPGAGAPRGRPLHQDRHDHLRADHPEGLRPGLGGVPHARGRPPHDEEPDRRHGHDHLPRASADEHRHQPEEQLRRRTSGKLSAGSAALCQNIL